MQEQDFIKKENNSSKKTSISYFLIFFSLTFLLVFISITITSYNRLYDYKNIIEKMTDDSIPKVIKTANIYSQVNELVFLTQKLNQANTQVHRRIVHNEILIKIKDIRDSESIFAGNEFLFKKFRAIEEEFIKLNELISKRLVLENKIKRTLQSLNDLNNRVIIYTNKKKSFLNWKLNFSKIINISLQSTNISRLNLLKANFRKLEDLYTLLENNLKQEKQKDIDIYRNYTFLLKENIFKKDALIDLKRKKLKINSRAIGRGNFVVNLVKGFAGEVEYLSLIHNESLIKQSKENFKKVQKQAEYIFVFSSVGFLYLVIIIFYVRTKIVKRLVTLNNYVNKKLLGRETILEDEGSDEISHITRSFNFYASKVEEQKAKLEELSLTDGLTNIANRRFFDIRFESELNSIKRDKYCSSIFMIDVDYFKLYNDTYGHLAGDECLKKVAYSFRQIIRRDIDLLARYGGEEFVCILSHTDVENSKLMAQRILDNVNNLLIPHKNSKASNYVSVSIGIKTINPKENFNSMSLIEEADKALYIAKHNGRNSFIHFDEIKGIS